MANWGDIKGLAAQLKKVQASESINVLSERTCVDIISYLASSGRLNLIRTVDGRSFLTNKELEREILDELEAHGGKISLVELSVSLDVELFAIESRISDVIANTSLDPTCDSCLLVGTDLLTKGFIRKLAEELRDLFEVRGFISTIDLTRLFAFPPQFIIGVISEFNGVVFKVNKEDEKYYTDSYLNQQRSKIVGYFSAVITPITVVSVSSKLDIPQKLLTSLLENLIIVNRLQGSLSSGKSIYIPSCYSKAQNDYIKSFYAQNGFVEWNLIRGVGISNPSLYVHSNFPNAIHMRDVSVNENILLQLKSVIADGSEENTWIDVASYLPSSFGSKEREWLVSPLLMGSNLVQICDYSYLCTKDKLKRCMEAFDELLQAEAVAAAAAMKQSATPKTGSSFQSESHEKSSKASARKTQSGGFGIGAREVRTKNVKKKYLSKLETPLNTECDSDDSCILLKDKVSRETLLSLLVLHLDPEAPDDLVEGILETIWVDLNEKFVSLSKSAFLHASESSKTRNRFGEEKDALVLTIQTIQLFERGALWVDDSALRIQLLRHLIRSDVSTFVNRLYILLAALYDIEWPSELTSKQAMTQSRLKRNSKKKVNNEREDGEDDPEIAESEPTDSNPRSAILPADITQTQRDDLLQTLSKLSTVGPTREATKLLQKLNSCLRPNYEIVDSDEGGRLPLDTIFELCDDLAASHLGINLSVSVLRSHKMDSKRKRREKALALDILLQTEQQLNAACEAALTIVNFSNLAGVALAATCLFGHYLLCWPIPCHGKLVPSLTAWLQLRLTVKKLSPAPGLNLQIKDMLSAANVGNDLVLLKDIVMQRARGDCEAVPDDAVKILIQRIQDIGKKCKQSIDSGS